MVKQNLQHLIFKNSCKWDAWLNLNKLNNKLAKYVVSISFIVMLVGILPKGVKLIINWKNSKDESNKTQTKYVLLFLRFWKPII